jgi:hypothetical protein
MGSTTTQELWNIGFDLSFIGDRSSLMKNNFRAIE